MHELGFVPENLYIAAAAAALLYKADPKWEKQKSKSSYESILKDFRLISDKSLVQRIMAYIPTLEQGKLCPV